MDLSIFEDNLLTLTDIAASGALALNGVGTTLSSARFVEPDLAVSVARTLDVSSTQPVVNSAAPGGYTQTRRYFTFKVPQTLSNGNITINTVKMQTAFDPQATAAEQLQNVRQFLAMVNLTVMEEFIKNADVS